MIFDEPPGRGRFISPRLLIVCAVLFGVVILVLAQVLTRTAPRASGASAHGADARPVSAAGSSGAPVSGNAATPVASPVSERAGSGAACNVSPALQAIPTSAPANVTWKLYNTVALPFSPQAGPMVVNRNIARCYAHSPTGALLAAVQIAVRSELAADWQHVVADQVVPGAGRDVYVTKRKAENVTIQPGEYGQIAGFGFITYTNTTAVVQIAVRLPSGGLQAGALTVQWFNGDWRLVVEPDGAASTDGQQLYSLTGFVTWEGI